MQSGEPTYDSSWAHRGVQKIVEELEKIGDERLKREQERLFEFLDQEKNKMKKKAKAGSEGDATARSYVFAK